MWCKVQQCRGPNGEVLRRRDWSQPILGDVTIGPADSGWVAWLERLDVDRRYQLLPPLFDVQVRTFREGLLVIGCTKNVSAEPVRECRQAWYCVPMPTAQA